MTVPPEHREDFEALPTVLRALLADELAAGNAIVEVGHSHPAPPAGAYFKLAQAITTRPRASGDGIDFYERSSSLHSGEFTDAKRFYFILEPPKAPPPEPDMDAIRRAMQGAPSGVVTRAVGDARHAWTLSETASGAVRRLQFCDERPPHEIQFLLERDLMALFASAIGDGRLVMSAHADIVGAPYVFELHFEAAMPAENYYALRVETSWGGQPATHQHYYRTTSESWFRFWTRNFRPAKPPRPDAGQGERYRALCTAALEAERHLDSIPAIQSAIVAAMKRGARFTTSHKEGGTNLTWNGERFLRVDDGEYPAVEAFSGEAEFLAALRQFYDWEVSRNVYPDKAGELVAWKLILRLLRTA